jgi:hypothetical protein
VVSVRPSGTAQRHLPIAAPTRSSSLQGTGLFTPDSAGRTVRPPVHHRRGLRALAHMAATYSTGAVAMGHLPLKRVIPRAQARRYVTINAAEFADTPRG